MTLKEDPFAPIKAPRSLDSLVACPHCAGVVNVTVETHRARIDMISLLWDAFYEHGTTIEIELEQLRSELELRTLRLTRGTPLLLGFHEANARKHSPPPPGDSREHNRARSRPPAREAPE